MKLLCLLNTQKDSLFKIIISQGFDPQDFTWDNREISTIRYVKGQYFCRFQMTDDYLSRMIIYSPGSMLHEEYYGKDMINWQAYENAFIMWLTNLKRELNADSLWEKLRIEVSKITTRNNIDNEYFNQIEKDLIQKKLESIKVQVENLNIGSEKLDIINKKLDHLFELTEKLNKVDWLSILIGSIAGLILDLVITQDVVAKIWEIIKHEFEIWIFLP